MARERRPSTEERVHRDVARQIANILGFGGSAAVLLAWAAFGYYELQPQEQAVILRFGRYDRTVTTPGPGLHLPPPIESHEIVSVTALEREEFGIGAAREEVPPEAARREAAIQTKDNNIVLLEFVVQYFVKREGLGAFQARFRVAEPRETLRDAAQAAIREVVGRTSIDGVLAEQRGEVEAETRRVLQGILDGYESGLYVDAVELQEIQPPPDVRDAFDDVLAAAQDRTRAVNEAQGYANEVLPRARAEANELREAAVGYRDAKIADAQGEAARFQALATEYRKAPEVTRKRLYLEAMEEVLPEAEKVIIDPDAGGVLPYFPIGRGSAP